MPAELLNLKKLKKQVVPVKQDHILKDRDRVFAQLVFHHEHCCVDPFSVPAMFTAFLETIEQSYKRQRIVDKKKQPLLDQSCWLEDAGIVIIINNAGKNLQVNPSDKEIKATKSCILLVGEETMVRPGRFTFIEPVNAKSLQLSAHPSCKKPFEITVAIIPR